MCTQPIVAKKGEEEEQDVLSDVHDEGDEEEMEEEIWEELGEVSDFSEEEAVEVDAENVEADTKEPGAVDEEVGLRQRRVDNGQGAVVSCLFDGD